MPYTWLLFDADETLLDYSSAEAAALERAAMDRLGRFQASDLDIYRRINKALWLAYERGEITREALRAQRFAQWLQATGASDDGRAFGEHYLHRLGEQGDLIPGAVETLATLREPYRLALITNGFSQVQRERLARTPFSEWFSPIIISEEVGAKKPEPGIFDIALREMGNPPRSEVLLIGDSLSSDMAGGIGYGLDTCWFNPHGQTRPTDLGITHEISSLPDLAMMLCDVWYHGSRQDLIHLRVGSTVTRQRHLAEVFSSKPSLVCINDQGTIRHDGTLPGTLYCLGDELLPGDLTPHAHSNMPPGVEWLTTRDLPLRPIAPTQPIPSEHLSPDDVARILAGRDRQSSAPQ